MADTTTDPNAAPMHHDVQEDFAPIHVWLAGLLGMAALVVGLVLGIILVND